MFVEYSTQVGAGLADVENRLDRLRGSLEEWADIAYREGEQLRATVGPGAGLAREVNLQIGMAEIHGYGIVYPIHWTATEAATLFPELKADLILAKKGASQTQLTLRGTYDPPLGFVGRIADKAGLRRLAEATVHTWLDRIAAELSPD